MKLKSLEAIFRALQEAEARYLVVGGVAVIAHGYVRFTKDLDLVLDLSADHLRRALTALQSLGYRPIIPVPLLDFADPELRKDWTENRNMKVFNVISDRYPDVTIDIFPKEPLIFDIEYAAGEWRDVALNMRTRVVSVPALIAQKANAYSDLDPIDIDKLQKLHAPAPMKVNESTEPWPACDWEGSELFLLRRGASRSFRENLIWLEEATEFAEKFSKAPWHKEGIKPSSRKE